jgi:hypothetical protein
MSAADVALPRPSQLPLRSQALYRAAVAADYGLRTGLASLASTTAARAVLADVSRSERRRLEWYAEQEPDAAVVFPVPARVDVEVRPGRNPGLAGGTVELLRFESGYVALNPSVRRAYARHVNNQTARAQHWRHHDGPRPTLCVIHGFGASPARFNSAFFSLEEFFAGGWDIVLFTLPFHGSRRSDHAPFNGLELFAYGMSIFGEAILHAIHDLRALLDHVQARGAPRFGVTGLSLGGYASALAACADPRLDFAIPNAAVTHLPPMLDAWFPANVVGCALRLLSRVPKDLLERALAIHGPLSYAPVVPRERLMIVAGLGDRLAPPEQSLLLWEHWGRPELQWFPGSHVLHFGRGGYQAAMRSLMDGGAASERAAA